MPLLAAIQDSPEFQKVQLQQRFDSLPLDDKQRILKRVQEKQSSVQPDDSLSEGARLFVQEPMFRELYDKNIGRGVANPNAALIPIAQGLMKVLGHLTGEGALNPDLDGLVGGETDELPSPDMLGPQRFEMKLSEAFESGGAPGLASAHRDLMRDPDYIKFLSSED